MLRILRLYVRKLCIKVRFKGFRRRRPKSNITFTVVQRRKKPRLLEQGREKEFNHRETTARDRATERYGEIEVNVSKEIADRSSIDARRIRIATFNVALFSLAPAVPKFCPDLTLRNISEVTGSPNPFIRTDSEFRSPGNSLPSPSGTSRSFPSTSRSKKIIQSGQNYHSRSPHFSPSVGIKPSKSPSPSFGTRQSPGLLPLYQSEASTSASKPSPTYSPKSPMSPRRSWHASSSQSHEFPTFASGIRATSRTIFNILREADADVVALQDVKADEANGMKPLSELAEALGMQYVFAESWAPEFGNAVLSRWPIKRWQIKKLPDESHYKNVLKVVVDVPSAGELHFYCTHLDHLDEDARMKQVMSLMKSSAMFCPHILSGGLNALEPSDYSRDRWNDIAKLRESDGKMPPRDDVMKFLTEQGYMDSKNFAGESDSVVVLPQGQDVQGTCKNGTRIDYLLASPHLPYRFVPGSYAIISSKGTSDHHLVKVDIQSISQ